MADHFAPQASPEVMMLAARDVNVVYEPVDGPRIWSVRDASLELAAGEFVGLVGESGCGKTTLGYALTRMLRPPARLSGGTILFDGEDISALHGEALRRRRPGGFALVLQSGMNALNPVRTVEKQFHDVLKAHGLPGRAGERGAELLAKVSLEADVLRRFAHELSGGMRQRVAIALALTLSPKLVVFDEPTTALDVIVQQAVLQTIKQLQRQQGFTALLISHDLGVVLDAADRVLVMYAGRIVEDQPARDLVSGSGAHHPYTEALLSCYADPRAEQVNLGGIPGLPPDLSVTGSGCPYAPRCPIAVEICSRVNPPLAPLRAGRAACHVRAPAQPSPGLPVPPVPPARASTVDSEVESVG